MWPGARSRQWLASHLKKTVLELGGSDAFVVLDDADLDLAAEMAVKGRFMNAGQSCIAAKRFIVVESVEAPFLERLRPASRPCSPVIRCGATPRWRRWPAPTCATNCTPRSRPASPAVPCYCRRSCPRPAGVFYYARRCSIRSRRACPPTTTSCSARWPAVIHAADEDDALRIANDTRFGLGGSVWTEDAARGERFARRMACGSAFVNGMVKSDPRLPFGGIGDSGYGRELSRLGIREFVNQQTLWVR
jgi:succinate-semialdehyde dehydrogenase/glutarate-semialdehyde dehydrogenase